MTVAATFLELARYWLLAGAGVALVFLTVGIDHIDEDAQGAFVFRILLIPGVLLIWPLVLWRWYRLKTTADDWRTRYRPPRAAHLPAAVCLATTLLIAVAAGLAVRQSWPAEFAPQHLSEVKK
ncbi:hypothetical protein [Ruegeria atlantica]|uniref:hypothetical protein n=1 Tax=Ruegeria atlantica TaxID=81569 RepID=UPI00147D0857|nr:hypothetical protein [Ruegeria atlantica]